MRLISSAILSRRFAIAKENDSFATAMITVTENAVRQLRTLLSARPATDGQGLRVGIAKGGCSGLQYEMSLDARQPGDEIIERDGVEFFVDAESADYLRGSTLDYRDGLTGAGFHIENPNAARTCGCGTSFEAARPA
jgi:iron-sulfur cluster assembly accessory protein